MTSPANRWFSRIFSTSHRTYLTHVEVIQTNHTARLRAYFDPVPALPTDKTLILILPAAHPDLACPVTDTAHLTALGTFRGTVPHLSTTP